MLALAFICGLAYEAICTAWVAYVEEGRAPRAAVAAFLAAAAEAGGVGESILKASALVAYALGCAVGTAAVILVRRLTKPPEQSS